MSNTVYHTAFAADVQKTLYLALNFRLSIYKNAPASAGLRLPDLLSGLSPGPHWGTSVPRPLVGPQFNLLDPPLQTTDRQTDLPCH